MQYTILLITVSTFLCFHAQAVSFGDCGSYFHFDNVELDGCGLDVCILTIGTNVSVSFSFDSGNIDIDGELTNDVSLIIVGTKFGLSVTPDNPCAVLKCPIEKNYVTTYKGTVFISDIFPPLHADFKWIIHLNDSLQSQLVCFTFPVTIMRSGNGN